ncbi:MAG: aconitate hydratase [Peptoniphilaceae bacterium]|nr:aconitate hydratase [Peptoniphilaceae bacterium]MDY5842467.1 aconitate hydratase [Peptoniphilaceae bacterium]
MRGTLAAKIMQKHLLDGELIVGKDVMMKIDQTLTQDSTGTMAYLQMNTLGVDRVKTELSVAYIDHNMLQSGFENADDHAFIRSCAAKYGIVFSKPGGGICHQVHLERFGAPGKTLLGSDSHTPTDGGLGALAIGAGGLDVAVAMAKGFYSFRVPSICAVRLTGRLQPGVNAKDVILEILKRMTVKGGVGKIMEYTGEGVLELSVTDRATICNMGAELGATTSIFPSDVRTEEFLRRQGRAEAYQPLKADEDAEYEEFINVDLSEIEPMIACPHSPDNVVPVREAEGVTITQVCIGSCTNSSYTDIMRAARILDGKKVAPDVDLTLSPGSSNILRLISENGALATFIRAGARILESACGPCIGMGQSPRSGGVSLRTFNRNFKGRSGTMDAGVYLVSPETAAASAIRGRITDPRTLEWDALIEEPETYGKVDHYFVFPPESAEEREAVSVIMGPNIKPFPVAQPPESFLGGHVLLQAGDNVTTDDICPSNARLLPFRSNIPYLSQFGFTTLIPDFAERAKKHNGGFIVAGENYGQGSSREHAALIPLYLGVKAVFAKSFARIHRSNLINNGILPLVFHNPADYGKLAEMDRVTLADVRHCIESRDEIAATVNGEKILFRMNFTPREREILLAGGYLNFVKSLKA